MKDNRITSSFVVEKKRIIDTISAHYAIDTQPNFLHSQIPKFNPTSQIKVDLLFLLQYPETRGMTSSTFKAVSQRNNTLLLILVQATSNITAVFTCTYFMSTNFWCMGNVTNIMLDKTSNTTPASPFIYLKKAGYTCAITFQPQWSVH